MEILNVFEHQIMDFIYIFPRVSGIVAVAPLLGAKNVPNVVKAWITFFLAIFFTIVLSPLNVEPPTDNFSFMIRLAGEAAIGAAIGFVAMITFEIVLFAGYIVDYMVGFGFINIIDPQSGASVSLFGFFFSFLTVIVFVLIDAHHVLIEAMVRSYELIPLFGSHVSEDSIQYLTRLGSTVFSTGFRIAAPIFTIMFLVDFVLGMLGKTVPQLQILVVGFPIKIGIGLISSAVLLKPIMMFIAHLFENYRDMVFWAIHYWGRP